MVIAIKISHLSQAKRNSIFCHTHMPTTSTNQAVHELVMICLFLNVHGKQLRSCWNGHYLITLFLGKPPRAVYQYLVPILLPVTENLLFLNKLKREMCQTRESISGPIAY